MTPQKIDRIQNAINHINTASDVDEWACELAVEALTAQLAGGCSGCAFENTEEWEMPCRACKRNCKDYWRKAE